MRAKRRRFLFPHCISCTTHYDFGRTCIFIHTSCIQSFDKPSDSEGTGGCSSDVPPPQSRTVPTV